MHNRVLPKARRSYWCAKAGAPRCEVTALISSRNQAKPPHLFHFQLLPWWVFFSKSGPKGEVCPKRGTWQSSPCFFLCCCILGTPLRPQHCWNAECLAVPELSPRAACPAGGEPRSLDIKSPAALHRKPLADLTAELGEIPFATNSEQCFTVNHLNLRQHLKNHKIRPSLLTTKLYSQPHGLVPAGTQRRGAGLCHAAGGRTFDTQLT